MAQLRISDAESRLDALESAAGDGGGAAAATVPTTTTGPPPTTGPPSRPPDTAEARAAVVGAFETVYRGGTPIDERLANVDDPSGVEAALTAATEGPLAGVVATAEARVEEVLFTSAAAATVTYTVTAQGAQALQARAGTAVAVDGTWKVSRATICGDLSELGFPCG